MMSEGLRKFLEANGLRKDATEEEAWRFYDKLEEDGIQYNGDIGTRSAGSAPAGDGGQQPASPGPQRGEVTLTPEIQAQIDRAVAQAAAQGRADQTRMIAEIDQRLSVAGLLEADSGDFRRTIVEDPAMTVERASEMIFERMSQHNPAIGGGAHSGFEVGTESREKLRDAITDGLLMRSGFRIENPAEGHREFRGRHLKEICRELMLVAGVNVRGLSDREMVGRALASGSTSDFPNILGNLVGRTLLQAYMEAPSTWRPFVAITGANDFKAIHALNLSEAPDLLDLDENGEYRTAKFSESAESYRVITKGRVVPLTRQMIINDDLRAFTRIPMFFGAAARRMESDAVYDLLIANAAMATDSKALFHADHKNLTGTGTALSTTSLGVGRAMMRKQTGPQGAKLDITPVVLLVPTALETSAEVILRSTTLPEDNKPAGTYNPFAGKLTPVAEPRLDDNSVVSWYLFGSPTQAPVIEAAFLEGEEQPYIEEMVDFDSDALKIKVRHDFGCGVVDFRGAYKNNGSA